MITAKIGMLGCGTVGGGVLKMLAANGGWIRERDGVDIQVKRILVSDLKKERAVGVPPGTLTTRAEDIFEDPEIGIVVEALAGEQPAADYLLRAIRSGRPVVTANKSAVASHWNEIMEASGGGRDVYFEASVCGGIPVIGILTGSMQANRIRRVMGIVNGTTNYILTRMTDDAAEYAEALKQAQRLGFAEADPTADVEGEDAASKLSIIASLASGRHVPVERIYREGITRVTMEDIAIGRELGFTLKMLAITSSDGDAVEARVHPTFIPSSHPLASVSDSFNAVFLEGDAVGELMLYGRGAGDLPTASSVISDIVVAARTAAGGGGSLPDRAPTASRKPSDAELSSDWTSEYYVRMTAMDKPGVLAQIAGVFGEHRISIGSLIQRGYGQAQVPLVFITHPARRHAMEKAINQLWNLPVIKSIDNVIHVVR